MSFQLFPTIYYRLVAKFLLQLGYTPTLLHPSNALKSFVAVGEERRYRGVRRCELILMKKCHLPIKETSIV